MIDRMMKKMDDMYRDFENTFQQLDEQLGSQIGDRFGRFPIDVQETDNNIVVTADLPGVEKDRINVKASSTSVTIEASDEQEVREEGKNYIQQERRAKDHRRHVQLPVKVDPDSAEASYTNGVLTVTLSKEDDDSGSDVEIT